MLTLHEHHDIGGVERSIACLSDGNLSRAEGLPDRECRDRSVVVRDVARVRLDPHVKCVRARQSICVVVKEHGDLHGHGVCAHTNAASASSKSLQAKVLSMPLTASAIDWYLVQKYELRSCVLPSGARYCSAGSRANPMENTADADAVEETVPRSCASAKTGQSSWTARNCVSCVFASLPALMNCARTTMSWPVWYVALAVCGVGGK